MGRVNHRSNNKETLLAHIYHAIRTFGQSDVADYGGVLTCWYTAHGLSM